MAVVQLNLSRRALLGAGFAVPVLSIIEGPVLTAVRTFGKGERAGRRTHGSRVIQGGHFMGPRPCPLPRPTPNSPP